MASKMLYDSVIVVTRKTELDELVARFATTSQARFYLEHAGRDFAPIEAAHERYYETVGAIRRSIPRALKTQTLDRSLLPQYLFGESDLVITIGQDGLVSNTAKHLSTQPILAVNPDPAQFDGVLLPFTADDFDAALAASLHGRAPVVDVTLALAELSDGQSLLAFNDFFIGAASHVSARYTIIAEGRAERQSSSGVIVSTGAGSTGWLQSVYAGAAGVVEALGGKVIPPANHGRLAWDEETLIYSVREPFPSRVTGTSIVHGRITRRSPLIVTSLMGTNGVIFSDGIESDYLAFNHGAVARISIAPRKAHLIAR